jgi:hypothetical protein
MLCQGQEESYGTQLVGQTQALNRELALLPHSITCNSLLASNGAFSMVIIRTFRGADLTGATSQRS